MLQNCDTRYQSMIINWRRTDQLYFRREEVGRMCFIYKKSRIENDENNGCEEQSSTTVT